jgi:hypothetical protein
MSVATRTAALQSSEALCEFSVYATEYTHIRDRVTSLLKELRLRAGEYLRRGIDDIRAAAAFVFSKDEEKLGRYPVIRRTRRRAGDKTEDEPDTPTEEVVETDEPQSGSPKITAEAPAESTAR